MFKPVLLLAAVVATTYSAEISTSYSLLEKNSFNQEPRVDKELKPEPHPVYRGEEVRNQGRARIEPVRPSGPVIKHDGMLADQPVGVSTEVNRIDEGIIGNGYLAPISEVSYPDIQYAPGYMYDTGYGASNNYDMYAPNNYLIEPDMSTVGLLWSQVPDARTMVSFVGRTISFIFNSIFVLLMGSLITVGVCTYTNLCSIAFHGVGPIHEEMRSLVSPERLEKISHAAEFVKTAIDKYQKIQKATNGATNRQRRAIFKY